MCVKVIASRRWDVFRDTVYMSVIIFPAVLAKVLNIQCLSEFRRGLWNTL